MTIDNTTQKVIKIPNKLTVKIYRKLKHTIGMITYRYSCALDTIGMITYRYSCALDSIYISALESFYL